MFFAANEIINEAYEILESLDVDNRVWLAYNNREGKKAVIKVGSNDDKFNLSYEYEAAIKLAKHNNIAYCYWVKTIYDRLCIAYEHIDGTSLKEYWRKNGKSNNYEFILSTILQLIEAISFIEKNGYVLHDITPENIYIIHKEGKMPLLKLIDFDVITKIGKEDRLKEQKVGRFKYMPVESFATLLEKDGKTNLSMDNVTYSIAFILYQMISKSHKTPFEEIENDNLTMEDWFSLHSKVGSMFEDDPDLVPFDRLFHDELQDKDNKDSKKNQALRVIYYLIEGCCREESERTRFEDLKRFIIEQVIEEYLYCSSSRAFIEFVTEIKNNVNIFTFSHSDDLNNKGVSMTNISKYIAETDRERYNEYTNESKKYFQLAIRKNCKHFESRINLMLLNCEEEPFNYNILEELNNLIDEYQMNENHLEQVIHGTYLLSYYSLINGDIYNASEYIEKALKHAKKSKSILKDTEDNFYFIKTIIDYANHKNNQPLNASYYKKGNRVYGERIEKLLKAISNHGKEEINNRTDYCNETAINKTVNSMVDLYIPSVTRYYDDEDDCFLYACFSPSHNKDGNQILATIDKEGKIHRWVEENHNKEGKKITYLEKAELKSKGNKYFTHVTFSHDNQTILAIDKEGKITIWSKHDYEDEDEDEEYSENLKLAKAFNETGQAFTYACFSPSHNKDGNQILATIDKEGKITIWSKHDYEDEDEDEEYSENLKLAKAFNETGQAFTYACFSPSHNKDGNQILATIDKEGKIHRWVEENHNKEGKKITYLEKAELKSKGNKYFTHVTFSHDNQTILAIDKEGKITIWSKHDYEDEDEEYSENLKLAKAFNETGQAFTYACFSPSPEKNFLITKIKDRKVLALWKLESKIDKVILIHAFHLDSASLVESVSFSSDSDNVIFLNNGILYLLYIQNIENNKTTELIPFDNYYFSYTTRSFSEDFEFTQKFRNSIKETSPDTPIDINKKVIDFIDKTNPRHLGYVGFDELKDSILQLKDMYGREFDDINYICKLADFSNNLRFEDNTNTHSKGRVFLSRPLGVYTFKVIFDENNNYSSNISNIILEINPSTENIKTITIQFQRYGSSTSYICISPTGHFQANKNNKFIDSNVLPKGLSDMLIEGTCSGIYISNNKRYVVAITYNGEVLCYVEKHGKFKKQFHLSFEEEIPTDICFNKVESIFMVTTLTGGIYIYRKDGILIEKVFDISEEPIINALFSVDSDNILIFSKTKIKIYSLNWKPHLTYRQ